MTRSELFDELLNTFDEGYELVNKYDAMPHKYGEHTLFQAEMHMLQMVGRTKEATITEIAKALGKTASACSQMVKRLRNKELIRQIRNSENNREYYLELTKDGIELFDLHEKFDNYCIAETFEYISGFSDEELKTYIKVQKKLNEAFKNDVRRSMDIHDLQEIKTEDGI